MRSTTWDQVRARRLARHHLHDAAPAPSAVDAVRAVGGAQAQVLSAAELGIVGRTAGATVADIRAELWEHRRLVKVHSLRGTLHLHAADELPMWMAAMRRVHVSDLPATTLEALVEAARAVLDGRELTRQELADAIGGSLRDRLASTWADLIVPLQLAGVLCYGPTRGAKVTFVRPDQWAGDDAGAEWDPEDALNEVLRRYLRCYGPARPDDFARWTSMTPARAKPVFHALADELEEVDIEGYRAWQLAGDDEDPPATGGLVRLVPQYDGYALGFHPRDRLAGEEARARVRSYGRARFEGVVAVPLLLVDGTVGGIWERRVGRHRVDVRVEPFDPVDESRLAREADAVGRALDKEVVLSLGPLAR